MRRLGRKLNATQRCSALHPRTAPITINLPGSIGPTQNYWLCLTHNTPVHTNGTRQNDVAFRRHNTATRCYKNPTKAIFDWRLSQRAAL